MSAHPASQHPERHRLRSPSRLAVATGLGLVLSTVIAATPASAAEPFTPDELSYSYSSNASFDYTQIMDLFTDIVANQSDVIAINDSSTVRINNTATATEEARAIVDQYGDMSVTMADGLGANLGAIYTAAMAAGELPKTQALIAKSGGLVGYYASTNPAKAFFAYERPYLRFSAALIYRDKVGGDAWGSTSGSYPSGHTSQAYWQGTTLATLLPELAPQILARTSEAGNNRIILAAHYPLDVMSGRMMGQKIVEGRWSDPEFRVLLEEASTELHTVLEAGCGATLDECIAADTAYLSDEDALAIYEERMTYDFVQTSAAGVDVTIPTSTESLLISSHPTLTAAQRRQVLELTAIDSGYPLDEGTDGSWLRVNLAAAMAAEVTVNTDGSVSLASATSTPVTDVTDPATDATDPTTDTTDPTTDVTDGTDGTDGTDSTDTTEVAGTTVEVSNTIAEAFLDTTATADTSTASTTNASTSSSAVLASTGTETTGAIVAALAFLVAGSVLVLRRRRSARH